MNTYLLTLKQKSGLLSPLQSDSIFGHFCWRLKELYGNEKLTEFLSLYKNNKPIFTVSDGLLKVNDEILFPRPYVFSKPKEMKTKTDKIFEFVKQKENKERKYIKLSELNGFLKSGELNIKESHNGTGNAQNGKRKQPLITESLRVSVQIDRNTFGSSEGRLFSYNPVYLREDTSYVILIKILDENNFKYFNSENILQEVFEIGYGKKKSSGYGQFKVEKFAEFNELSEPEEHNSFVVMGNYLPSTTDEISPIGYNINTKYGKLGEELSQAENPFKNPVVFFTAGSCFKSENRRIFYGRITDEGEISDVFPHAVQSGVPFTLNFNY